MSRDIDLSTQVADSHTVKFSLEGHGPRVAGTVAETFTPAEIEAEVGKAYDERNQGRRVQALNQAPPPDVARLERELREAADRKAAGRAEARGSVAAAVSRIEGLCAALGEAECRLVARLGSALRDDVATKKAEEDPAGPTCPLAGRLDEIAKFLVALRARLDELHDRVDL